jgi:hypothetical protein
MLKTTNAKARSCVQSLTEFKASNTFAEYINGVYVVFSYGHHFPMFANVGGTWYANEDKYSRTTSKQRGQLHPLVDCAPLNTRAMQALYA